MGSTGHGVYKQSRTGNVNTETFGIVGAVNYKGKIPANSGLSAVGANKVTLKIPAGPKSNILFQFKLTKDAKFMTILAYKSGVPEEKCKVNVDAKRPSIDRLMRSQSKADKLNAVKMKDFMNKSASVDEGQLNAIAQKLLKHKSGGK